MPAKSQAQRGFLAAHFGPAWLKRHHFDNKGKLPDKLTKGDKPDAVARQLGKAKR